MPISTILKFENIEFLALEGKFMVKCSKCSERAVIRLRYARLNLCKKHLIEFIENRFIKLSMKNKLFEKVGKALVAVSGGKDSVTLLHLMSKAAEYFGFEIHGLTIDLGIGHDYSRKSIEASLKNFEMLKIPYTIFSLKKHYGFTIDDIASYGREAGIKKPVCSVCGTIKRYIMNKVALDVNADVIVTGHNLDDMVQYVLSSVYSGRIEDIVRLSLKTPTRGKLIGRAKPLAYFSEKETLMYVILKKLPFNYDVCPYYRPRSFHEKIKKISNELEETVPGSKITLIRSFLEKIQPALEAKYSFSTWKLRECKLCGMPTTGEICSFCKIRLAMENIVKR